MTRPRTPSARPRRSSFRPRCEALEDRLAPAVYTWTGAVSNLWSYHGNWAENRIPAGDSNAQLVFPANPTRYTSLNDLSFAPGPLIYLVDALTIQGAGYNISGNAFRLSGPGLGDGISATNASGANTLSCPFQPHGTDEPIPVRVANASATLNLTGTLRDASPPSVALLGFAKEGAGTLVLSGNNSYSVGTLLNAGVLTVGSNTALGTGPLTLNGGSLRASAPVTLANSFATGGPATVGGSQNLTFTGAGELSSSLTVNNTAGSTVRFNGPLSGPSGVWMVGVGSLVLAGNNSYQFGTRLNAGVLTVASNTALGTGSLQINGGSLRASAPVTLANAFSVLGTNDFEGSQNITFSGPGTLSVALHASNTTGTLRFNGPLSGPGGFVVDGPGVVALANAANSYTGPTLIYGGILRLGTNHVIPNASPVAVWNTGRLDLAFFDEVIGGLGGNGDVILGTNGAALTTGGLNTSPYFSGSITGPGSVTKQGTGTWTLAGAWNVGAVNVMAGTLDIRTGLATGLFSLAGGTVRIDASGYVYSTSNYIQNGGRTTLDGGGIYANQVNLQNGLLNGSGYIVGDLRNNARIDVAYLGTAGYLYVLGNYTQTAGGMLNIELGGPDIVTQYDFLYVEGTASLAGTLNVGRFGGYLPNPGDSFLPLYSGGLTSGVFGTMTGLPLGGGRELLPFYFDNGLLLYAT